MVTVKIRFSGADVWGSDVLNSRVYLCVSWPGKLSV